MTIDIPEFDPNLSGYGAVVHEDDSGLDLCHATVTRYSSEGSQSVTECGRAVNDLETDAREVFEEAGVRMCGECWPLEELVDTE